MSASTTTNKLVETRDGSHTVYSSQFDQHYHNPNGAVAESRYVFFEQTDLLEALRTEEKITILEIGFGTGLNLMLLLDYYLAEDSQTKIQYYSVEGFPLSPETVSNFNYDSYLDHPEAVDTVTDIFRTLSEGSNHFDIHPNITVHLFNGLFDDFNPDSLQADYLFHDAFSPNANPDLWTGEVFKKLKELSSESVVLSTYCAASKAQGAMAWAGWKIGKTRGALGKREMIISALDANRLNGLKRVNEERYARRYEEEDF